MSSLACAINLYNECNALPGALENAAQWADHIFVIHASPGMKPSSDGTMEILEKWGIKPVMADIMEGFGVIRTRLIKECGCDWAVVLDADERYMVNGKVLRCHGDEQFPHTLNPQNSVEVIDHNYAHMKWLRGVIDGAGDDYDAVRTCRRAWMDMSFKRPAQNWAKHPDWQLRIVKNNGHIGYSTDVRMHERIIDFRTNLGPKAFQIDDPERNLYTDHHNVFFKQMEAVQNTEDAATYDALDPGVSERMWIKYFPKA